MFEIPMHMTRSVLSLETKHISLRFFDLYSLFHSLRFCLVSHQRLKKINTSLNFHSPKLKTLKPSNCNWQITNILKIKILLQVSIAIQSLISTLWQKKNYSQSLTSSQNGKKVRYHKLCYYTLLLWIYWFTTKRNFADVIKIATQLTSKGKIM